MRMLSTSAIVNVHYIMLILLMYKSVHKYRLYAGKIMGPTCNPAVYDVIGLHCYCPFMMGIHRWNLLTKNLELCNKLLSFQQFPTS